MVADFRSFKTASENDILVKGLSGAATGVVPARIPSQASESKRISSVLNDIESLSNEEDVEGYIFRPTEFAIGRAKRLVGAAYSSVPERLPTPFVSPTGSGGIRIEWAKDRTISLVCAAAADQLSYVHHMRGNDHGSIPRVSTDSLVHWLQWLMANE